MSHFDYDQFLRQRGLVAPKRNAKSMTAPAAPLKPAPASSSSNLEDEFFNYDLPACNWNPGADQAFCGEGVICPPCG